MAGILNSGLNGSSSNFQDGSGRSLASVYSVQSGSSSAVLNNSGPQGIHDSYNMAAGYGSRNPTMMGAPSNGIQQVPGSVSIGRYAMNNLPTALSQLSLANSHGHSGLPNNGGSAISPNLGGAGRITNNISNLVSGGNIPRSIAAAGGSNLTRLNLTAPQMVSMLGNSYNGTAASLAKNHYQSGNSHISPMTMLSEMNAHDSAAFENEFPQLNHRPNSAGGSQGHIGYMRKQNMGFGQQNQEFSIQNEDFPALPGYRAGLNSEFPGSVHGKEQLHDGMTSMMKPQQLSIGRSAGVGFKSSYSSHQQQQQHSSSTDANELSFQPSSYQDLLFHGHENRSTGIPMPGSGSSNLATVSGMGPYEQSMQQYQQLQKHPQFRMVGGPIREQEQMQTSKAASDRYGIYGLLNVIRMTNPALTSLALGIDLTTLGLNLNSSENLHKKFSSPWSNEPAKGDPEYSVPECYISQQQPPLKQSHFSRINTETLFYIFYSMPKEEAQLYAANELHIRGWFYHKDLRLWLTRDPNTEPLVKTNTYERGCYFSFDPNTWVTTRKDNFVMQYELIEKRPVLPQQPVAA